MLDSGNPALLTQQVLLLFGTERQRVRFLFRELAIDQSVRHFALEAREDLLDGAELKRRAGLLAEPGGVSA